MQDGRTALHIAAREGLEGVVKLFLASNADPNLQDEVIESLDTAPIAHSAYFASKHGLNSVYAISVCVFTITMWMNVTLILILFLTQSSCNCNP